LFESKAHGGTNQAAHPDGESDDLQRVEKSFRHDKKCAKQTIENQSQ
jgi:hypothetical protein